MPISLSKLKFIVQSNSLSERQFNALLSIYLTQCVIDDYSFSSILYFFKLSDHHKPAYKTLLSLANRGLIIKKMGNQQVIWKITDRGIQLVEFFLGYKYGIDVYR